MGVGQLAQGAHVRQLSVEVDGQDARRVLVDRRRGLGRIEQARLSLHVGQDRSCADPGDRSGAGEEGEGTRHDPFAGLDAEGLEAGDQGVGARSHAHAEACSVEAGEVALEGLDLLAQHVLTAVQDTCDGLFERRSELGALGGEIDRCDGGSGLGGAHLKVAYSPAARRLQ